SWISRDQNIADPPRAQNPRSKCRGREERLIVEATAAADYRLPVLERIIGEAEARPEVLIITRRTCRLKLVVITHAEIQVQIRFQLHAVLEVESEDVAGELRARITVALVNVAQKAEIHLLHGGQRLRRNTGTRSGRPSPPASRGVASAVASCAEV